MVSVDLVLLGILATYFLEAAAIIPRFRNWNIRQRSVHDSFKWSNVAPSENLVYHNCSESFECARLLVPLDWQNSSNPHTVAVAIRKLPAKVPPSDPSYGGTIIVNPGGPGGSGTTFIQMAGALIQALVDGEKHYDILSFDPRGVYRTTPNAYCFFSTFNDEIWALRKRFVGNLGTGPEALKIHWAAEEARGSLCASPEVSGYADDENIRRHVSTASTARDMLEIVEKIHEHQISSSGLADLQPQRPIHFERPKPKLQYIGFSYGTLLGNTFASLFPDRVGRMVLDGNVDAGDWVKRYYRNIVEDAEKERSYIFERCYIGKSKCSLWRQNDTGPGDIESRVDSVLEKIRESPLPISVPGDAGCITYSDLQMMLLIALYSPAFFGNIADLLNDILTNQTSHILSLWNPTIPPPCPGDKGQDLLQSIMHTPEVQAAIVCSDSEDLSNSNISEFRHYLDAMIADSPTAGPLLAEMSLPCARWSPTLRTKWRFTGPFESSNPILFTNNVYDPVTPIANAKRNARGHQGSIVLEQATAGHCALFPPQECMWGHVRRYLHDGILPPNGTVCQPDCELYGEDCSFGPGMLGLLDYL